MKKPVIFIDRRTGIDRRFESDPCKGLNVDLYHRKRRKSAERRDTTKTLIDDYNAFVQANMERMPKTDNL